MVGRSPHEDGDQGAEEEGARLAFLLTSPGGV